MLFVGVYSGRRQDIGDRLFPADGHYMHPIADRILFQCSDHAAGDLNAFACIPVTSILECDKRT